MDVRLERLTKEADGVWTGPEPMFAKAGFTESGRGSRRAVYRLELAS